MKIKLSKPGGFLSAATQTLVDTTQIAALEVNEDGHTEITLRSGAKLTVAESVETVEKLCAEMVKQTTQPPAAA